MFKTYRIIPTVFIVFLFGLTFITVSPVLAEDSAAFVECQQIKGDLKGKKNCFKKLARELESSAADTLLAIEAIIAGIPACNADVLLSRGKGNSDIERLQCWIDYKAESYQLNLERAESELSKAKDDLDRYKYIYEEAKVCNNMFKSEIRLYTEDRCWEGDFCSNESRQKGCW